MKGGLIFVHIAISYFNFLHNGFNGVDISVVVEQSMNQQMLNLLEIPQFTKVKPRTKTSKPFIL